MPMPIEKLESIGYADASDRQGLGAWSGELRGVRVEPAADYQPLIGYYAQHLPPGETPSRGGVCAAAHNGSPSSRGWVVTDTTRINYTNLRVGGGLITIPEIYFLVRSTLLGAATTVFAGVLTPTSLRDVDMLLTVGGLPSTSWELHARLDEAVVGYVDIAFAVAAYRGGHTGGLYYIPGPNVTGGAP